MEYEVEDEVGRRWSKNGIAHQIINPKIIPDPDILEDDEDEEGGDDPDDVSTLRNEGTTSGVPGSTSGRSSRRNRQITPTG